MIVASSWSGGKDSCLACYKAMQEGHEVVRLVNFISQQYKRVSFHGIPAGLIVEQARSIGVPLLQRETTGNDYEEQFKKATSSLVELGIEGMVFGDIYLQEHRDWVERVCGEVGVEVLEPLWGMNTKNVLSEFINLGFEAIVVSAKSSLIEKNWVGHQVDEEFMKHLEKSKVDLCGENGEYHTFVTNGPIFMKRIVILNKEIISRNDHWFADILEYVAEDK